MMVRGQTRKWCELQPFWWRHQGYAQWADKKAEVGIFGLLFFGSFLLEEQKK
jgi:hypothetical protein